MSQALSDMQIIRLLEKEISASAWFGLAYLVDGFPRAVPQAEKFEAQIRPADLVLFLDCPENVMKERIGNLFLKYVLNFMIPKNYDL